MASSVRSPVSKIRDTHVFQRDLTSPYPVVQAASGVHVWDASGNEYLDASSGGNVVVSIGYGVSEVLDAMRRQAEAVCFAGGFTSIAQEELAAELAVFAGADLNYVRFTSGGSESTETAIKLARHHFIETGRPSKWKVIGRWRGYHGNTLGALSATGHVLRRREYGPMLLAFPHIRPPYRYRCDLCHQDASCNLACADDLETTILNEGPDEVAAFIAEPVVGAAAFGMVPAAQYWGRIREICDKYAVLLVTDEVLCGMGRTGRNFAIDHWGVTPDLVACGKGISSGYTPLGAVIAREHIYAAVHEGSGHFEHGFTYGGNPLSCAVGLAVLRYMRDNDLVQRAGSMGEYLITCVRQALAESPIVGDIDGMGMMVGVEVVADRTSKAPFRFEDGVAARITRKCRDRGVLITPCFSGNADGVRGDRFGVAPPYIFERKHVDETVAVIKSSVEDVAHEMGVA